MNRHDLKADTERLAKEIQDTEGLYERIEAARGQLSMLGDEMRGQTMVIKERVAWLIRELDSLRALMLKSTQPGDAV